jgi:hypothetical protein
MKKLQKIFLLFVFVAVPLALLAAMKSNEMTAPKGMEKTYVGLVSGNECALSGMKCDPSHIKYETPVFIPEINGKLDFKHIYYLSGIPVSVQDEIFLKEIRLSGTFYRTLNTVSVKTIDLKNEKGWKPFVVYIHGMTAMACCPKGLCCSGKGQACCHLHPEKKM